MNLATVVRRSSSLVSCAIWLLLCATPSAIVAESVGSEVTIHGTLTVYQEDDFASGTSREIHVLKDPVSGKTYDLDLSAIPRARLTSGTTIIVNGRLTADTLVVADGGFEALQQAALVTGQRNVIVLVIDFQDAAVTCSDSNVAALMFTGAQSVDDLYQETSFGALSFPGDTDGNGQPDVLRVSIAARSTDACDQWAWADMAILEAQNAGVDLSQYQHKLYILPSNSCTWAGFAIVGCSSNCEAFVSHCSLPDVYAHELGHNLGMRHASTDTNNDGVVNSAYGDLSDFMGLGGQGWRQVNGPHKEQMGWLPPSQIHEVTGSGIQTFTISPLETDPALATNPQLLKIFQPDRGDYYYLSYRQRAGYDQTLSLSYADRTNIHRYPGSSVTKFIAAIQDGQEFVDTTGGVTITQLSHDAQSATVRLNITCSNGSTDSDGDGTPDCSDGCPNDPGKTDPGICGCGVSDADTDGDGTADCSDNCPNDPNKTDPGICGCGISDVDTDGDGNADCVDACPADPTKTDPGICGCGVSDADTDGDGTADCNDGCPSDPNKTDPGVCGCGVSDVDTDGDGTADCLVQADELGADFGPEGLWHFELGGWSELSSWDPIDLVRRSNELAAEFGPGRGLWQYDGAVWQRLTAWNSYDLVTWGSDLVAAFDAGRGLWLHDTIGWTRLTSWEPMVLESFDTRLAAEFGPGRGLWIHDGVGWSKISDMTAEALEGAGSGASFDLAIDLGGNGLSVYDGVGLLPITAWDPQGMVAWNDELVVEFGPGRGLWSYGATGWVRLTSWDSYARIAWGDRLVAAFDGGRGLWLWDGASWTELSPWEPVEMVDMGRHLATDFGVGRGLWLYDMDTGWTPITSWTSEGCESLDLH